MMKHQFRYIHDNPDAAITFVLHDEREIMYSVVRNGEVKVTPVGYNVAYCRHKTWNDKQVSLVQPLDDVSPSLLEKLARQHVSEKDITIMPALTREDFAKHARRCDDYDRQRKTA